MWAIPDIPWPEAIVATLVLLAILTPPRRRRRARKEASSFARWMWSRRLSADSRARTAGRAGERKVAAALARAGYRAIHDVYLPIGEDTTQVDHVVLAGGAIVVLETKHMAGSVIGDVRWDRWTQVSKGRRRAFRNPVRQNDVHVAAVEAACGHGVPVVGLVVMSGSAIRRISPPDAAIGLAELSAVFAGIEESRPRTARSAKAWASMVAAARAIPPSVARRRHAATLARGKLR